MPRPGIKKIDFYPDPDTWMILQKLPNGSRNAVLNNLVKIQLAEDASISLEAQSNLTQLLRLRQSSPNHSFPDAARLSFSVVSALSARHKITIPDGAAHYLTLMFLQQVRHRSLSLEEIGTEDGNLELEAAFFQAVANARDWESKLAIPLKVAGIEVVPDPREDEDMNSLQENARKKFRS